MTRTRKLVRVKEDERPEKKVLSEAAGHRGKSIHTKGSEF